jgi:DNA-binding NarL/FixJ family response regulator
MNGAGNPRARVVIADDHAIVRAGLAAVLSQDASLTVVGEACNGIEAIALTRAHAPDLLVLDLSMPLANGLEVLEEVRRFSPRTRVIVLTGVASRPMLEQAAVLGAVAIVSKNDDGAELMAAIPQVLAGANLAATAVRREDSGLTRREIQVLQGLCRGETNAAIAERFGISPATVNNHRANLMRKLSVRSIAELMAVALKEGYLDAR